MSFCFCEAFSRNNKSVAVVSFITQNGLVIAQMSYGCYEYIIFRDVYFLIDLYLHNLNGVPENVSILTAPGFKVKLIIHHRPVSTATNRSLLAHRYNFVGNSSGNKEFLPEPPGIIR